ncbi:PDZ domain-containing protein [Dokdonella soli]|uniref:PDZ domain-containing protein n=1 Tax=Dokdonella soli TaxID=529810 RepID=A0ABN1IBT3_9GAMM
MTSRFAALVLLLMLAGCATAPRGVPEAPRQPATTNRYETEPGRDAAMVAELRAAPAPEVPELVPGKSPTSDHNRLAARGYVRIGTGYFPGTEATVRDAVIRQGQQVGADRVLLYAPTAGAATPGSGGEWLATYYVRFQLPFGATFRDLRAEERASFDAEGGVAIGSVIGGTPASRANLLAGDIVLKFDGKPIGNRAAFQGLLKSRAGHPVTLTIVRNGETLQRVVRLGVVASPTTP